MQMQMDGLISGFKHNLMEGLEIAQSASYPSALPAFQQVVILGMGGSGIGANMMTAIWANESKVPIIKNKSYNIPAFVDKNTLVIASSYSGNTEETLQAVEKAKAKGAYIACLCSGGALAAFAAENGLVCLNLPAGFPPRTMLGFNLAVLSGMLFGFGIIETAPEKWIPQAVEFLQNAEAAVRGEARQLALQLKDSIVIAYSTTPFESALLRLKQQINENSKMHCFINVFPELNHNELVGWRHENQKLGVLLFESDLDYVRNQKRIEVSKNIIAPNAGLTLNVKLKGDSYLHQMLYMVALGDWLSYELALINNEDNFDIREIDTLKRALGDFSQF